MPRDYRKILRERGLPDPPRGRPPLGPKPDRIRSLWAGLTTVQRAEFMAWANLTMQPSEPSPGERD